MVLGLLYQCFCVASVRIGCFDIAVPGCHVFDKLRLYRHRAGWCCCLRCYSPGTSIGLEFRWKSTALTCRPGVHVSQRENRETVICSVGARTVDDGRVDLGCYRGASVISHMDDVLSLNGGRGLDKRQ